MCIETGTRFVGKFTMTMHRGIRELLPKFGNELHERRLLCVSASVFRGFAVGSNATDVAHPDRVFVLPYAVVVPHAPNHRDKPRSDNRYRKILVASANDEYQPR